MENGARTLPAKPNLDARFALHMYWQGFPPTVIGLLDILTVAKDVMVVSASKPGTTTTGATTMAVEAGIIAAQQ